MSAASADTASNPAPADAADKRVWLNGELVPADRAAVSVFDHGLLYGDGVFEGMRVYAGRVFKLQTHLERLFDSAKAIRLDIPYAIDQLAEAVRETVGANGRENANGYIRLCVTRGNGPLGINPFICNGASTFIIVDGIQLYPREMYEAGLAVITASTVRNHPQALSPRVKSMNYLNNVLAKIEAIDAGVLEAVMLNHEGFVGECTGDNVFIVRERGGVRTLVTPPLHAGILEGVTRNVVMQLARDAGVPVMEADLTKFDLYTAEEMLLTGSAAEVIPVTKIDGRPVGEGRPGPITRDLIASFQELVKRDAPED